MNQYTTMDNINLNTLNTSSEMYNENTFENIGFYTIIVLIFGIIYYLAYNTQQQLNVNDYVVNTYMYILLALFFLIIIMMSMDDINMKYGTFNNINTCTILAIFVISIVILFSFNYIDRKNYLLRHILWLVYIICIAIIIFPIYDIAKQTSILWKTIAAVILIVLGLTYMTSKFPIDYFNSWGPYLSMGLIGLIFFWLIDLIFIDKSNQHGIQKIYGIIAIVLFSGFILYDTQKIYQNANVAMLDCQNTNNQLQCADYPQESLALFLDITNMFINMVMVQN